MLDWPQPVTYVLLVAFGYALTRVIDLACEWQRRRLSRMAGTDVPDSASLVSATARQHALERHAVYARFRKSVNDAVGAAVNQGHGSYGLLYQIRDDYGELLGVAPTAVSQSADSIIRCVTLLLNLGESDQRLAMFTRALRQFDEACSVDEGPTATSKLRRQEFSVLAESGTNPTTIHTKDLSAQQSEIDSASARART
ncbi:MAG: hypothetical protein R3F24_06905 [Gammaproteobacteria bacterium]